MDVLLKWHKRHWLAGLKRPWLPPEVVGESAGSGQGEIAVVTPSELTGRNLGIPEQESGFVGVGLLDGRCSW